MHCKLSLETENTGRTWTNIIPLDKSINKCQIILWNSSPSIFGVRRKLQISNLCLICFYSLFNNLKPASPSCKKEQEEKHVQHTWFFIVAPLEMIRQVQKLRAERTTVSFHHSFNQMFKWNSTCIPNISTSTRCDDLSLIHSSLAGIKQLLHMKFMMEACWINKLTLLIKSDGCNF